jgi:two-component system, cell cycle response regulator
MRILIAEDDPISLLALKNTLSEWGYEVVVAHDGDEAWQTLQNENAPTLAIVDRIMAGMDGLEFCKRARQSSTAPYIYTIMLLSDSEKESIVEAIGAGADDYVGKPLNIEELRVRLRAGRRIMELQRTLRMKTTYDALTGIWNRAMIMEVLQRELARAQRESTPVGVLMAELDGLKQINFNYGRPAGDSAVREVTKRIRAALRSYDLFGRYGGKEFLIILPGCDMANTLKVAERMRHIIGRSPVTYSADPIPVTISIGAATSKGETLNPDPLIQAVLEALERAKDGGRNRVEMANIN